ncbi:PCRF domain-containing protein [Escherichia coli]
MTNVTPSSKSQAGTGGDEAALFAGDVWSVQPLREARRSQVAIMSASEGEHGGYEIVRQN